MPVTAVPVANRGGSALHPCMAKSGHPVVLRSNPEGLELLRYVGPRHHLPGARVRVSRPVVLGHWTAVPANEKGRVAPALSR
jgi:hypothetical protein